MFGLAQLFGQYPGALRGFLAQGTPQMSFPASNPVASNAVPQSSDGGMSALAQLFNSSPNIQQTLSNRLQALSANG